MKRRRHVDPADHLCEVFFEQLLPGYLREVSRGRVAAKGKLQVTVVGYRPRTWTVDLDARTVHRGGDPRPDARLESCSEEWLLMIWEELSWEDCVRYGCVKHRGDRAVTAGFFELLAALPPVPVQLGDPAMVN